MQTKPELSQGVDLKEYVQWHFEQSYGYWLTSTENISDDERKRRAESADYPDDESLIKAIEADFNSYFPSGTSVEQFVRFMEGHGSNPCVLLSNDYRYHESEEIDGSYSCTVDIRIPLAYEARNLNPDEAALREARSLFDLDHTPTKEEFLALQIKMRFTDHWQFQAIADQERPLTIKFIRFSRKLVTF